MKSFPSTINEAQAMYGSGKANVYKRTFDIDRLVNGALNLTKSTPVINEQLKENNVNISNFQAYPYMPMVTHPDEYVVSSDPLAFVNNTMEGLFGQNLDEVNVAGDINAVKRITPSKEKVYFENPLELPAEIIALAKDYDWAYRYMVKEIMEHGVKSGESITVHVANTSIAPSMFNPMYGVSVLGIIRNTPLLNDVDDPAISDKTSDCSIRMLCALSKQVNSELGQARYKYSDFMYCKDLGRVSNNHLITLRKFAQPVTDHIFEMSSPSKVSGEYSFETAGDVGRLVTWFGTDDNKLEDIIKFSYHATFVEKNADWQVEDTTADSESGGIVGMIGNTFNPVYNKGVDEGTVGNHSLWGWLGSKLTSKVFNGIGQNNGLLRNYDNNKVYTPKNTIQSTHVYEGKLLFSNQFTLNFSYKLRAYENINPRSALLDLIGNILEVTYTRGKFWGGDRRTIGPPQNEAPFRIANKYIDNAWDKLSDLFYGLNSGTYNVSNALGTLAGLKDAVGQGVNNIINAASDFFNNPKAKTEEVMNGIVEAFKKMNSETNFSAAIKGHLKNMLGRPQAIAWHSILSGAPIGFWHVTIGNPRNPIIAMGNLILDDATITQSGPLGLDDFPTELKVSITLSHGTPRDLTDIGRMYTKGAAAIYHVMAHHEISDFWGSAPNTAAMTVNGDDVNIDEIQGRQEVPYKAPNVPKEQDGTLAEIKDNGVRASYNKELTAAQEKMAAPLTGEYGVPNPFIQTMDQANIIRKNNYADTMLRANLNERA